MHMGLSQRERGNILPLELEVILSEAKDLAARRPQDGPTCNRIPIGEILRRKLLRMTYRD
jgi:hypothetical protein